MPYDTPMLSHGRLLKAKYGSDVKVVFIGPCIAKKKEAEANRGIIDAALTFNTLNSWFNKEELVPEDVSDVPAKFEPECAGDASLYPIEGGMIKGMQKVIDLNEESSVTFSGLSNVKKVLDELSSYPAEGKLFLELLACEGGCVNGPGAKETSSLIGKRQHIISDHIILYILYQFYLVIYIIILYYIYYIILFYLYHTN